MKPTTGRQAMRMLAILGVVGLLGLAGCKDGEDGSNGPAGPGGPVGGTIETHLSRFAALPGLVLTVQSVGGATGPGGAFQAGDTISVTFTLALGDGTACPLDELDYGGIYVSGPTMNYQRVIARQTNLVAASVDGGGGVYTYTFATAIPDTYLAPFDDTATFGVDDGEWTGLPLISGTYTIGIEAYKNYYIEEVTYKDVSNVAVDFLYGSVSQIEPREVVTLANCNRCHEDLQVHSGRRRDTRLCVLCHTSGAEDTNDPLVAGGTPDVTLDFRVMIHKIHNGAHLPSVLGVGVNPDGTRNYAQTPEPYEIADGTEVDDFSEVGFPVWPNMTLPMPRDLGYSALPAADRTTEDLIRRGVTDCDKCHGDPDGSGPLPAPAEGDIIYAQPSRRACGACHDDIDWTIDYQANGLTMGRQDDDTRCMECHDTAPLAVAGAHLHPLLNANENPGLVFDVSSVGEGAGGNGDGTLDIGERLQYVFELTDGNGTPVAGNTLNACYTQISGPIENRNLLLNTSLPTYDPDGAGPAVATVPASIIGAGPTYTINAPEVITYERNAVPPGGLPQTIAVGRTPIWCDGDPNWASGNRAAIWERTATGGGATTTTAAALALQHYIEVASVAGFTANPTTGDWVAIDDGVPGLEEYARVALIEGTRVWLNVALRYAHASGASVNEVTMTSRAWSTTWTVTNAAAGQITLTASFSAGNPIIITYTTDFLVPSVFQPNYYDSPDIDATWGDWVGLPLLSGTYQVGISGYVNRNIVTVGSPSETTTYRGTSEPAVTDVLFGSATELTPYTYIDGDGETCNECHNDLWFHGGGRRGFNTCILCHGTPGEDRAQYSSTTTPATPMAMMQYRQMLHRIHRGADLANADTYAIGTNTFGEIEFPVMPGGVADCEKCHGEGNEAYEQPDDTNHPSQVLPRRVWRTVCTSCHDGSSVAGHADLMTDAGGQEACGVCHGPDQAYAVELMHWIR